jgi:hypothetical protein
VGLPPERIWSDAFLPIQIYVAKYYVICHASYHMRRLIGWARISAWSRFLAQPFGLIRLPCPSVRIRDNSRTKRDREFKFCMNTTYTK